jgi:hypothetical protein
VSEDAAQQRSLLHQVQARTVDDASRRASAKC